jgi:hypothetical protein
MPLCAQFLITAATGDRRGRALADNKFGERRGEQRISFQSPATFRTDKHTVAASTKDISSRGLFFFTDVKLTEGSEIDIVPLSGMVCCHGRVVRVEVSGGQYGIAIIIDRINPATPA